MTGLVRATEYRHGAWSSSSHSCASKDLWLSRAPLLTRFQIMRIPSVLIVSAASLCLAAAASAQTTFVDVTSQCGLDSWHAPVSGHPMAPMVGGTTVGDFNNDGWPDLFKLSGGTRPDYLFINQGNGTFLDQAAQWGLTDLNMGSGACVGDYDRDGWDDLYVTCMGAAGVPGNSHNHLYRNNGNSTFTDVAAPAGVQIVNVLGDGFGCAFGDYDRDGWLDLFVASYTPGTKGNRLFHNEQNGSFRDVTHEAGIDAFEASGFVPTFADMNGDRWPELLLIADHGSSEYYANDGDGTFTFSNSTVEDLDVPNAMGLCIADANGDGLLDFYVSDAWYPTLGLGGNRLYINHGDHNFTEEGRVRGCYEDGWGWGVTDLDMDNDGWVDFGATNGWFGQWDSYPSKMFHNLGAGMFADVTTQVGFAYNYQGRTIVHIDFDRDGDQDVILSASGGPLKAFRNDLANGNHWLHVTFDTSGHPGLAPNGFGTRVEVTTGGRTQVEYMDLGQTYLGCPEQALHFGLGAATVVDELRVEWSDGFSTVMHHVGVDQFLELQAQPPLTQTPLHRGQQATWTVTGAEPGEAVVFLYSASGVGEGNRIPALGGLRLDLEPTAQQAGMAVAGADGTAVLTQKVPATTPVHLFGFQAVIQRGVNGADSVKTNAILAPVLP